MLNETNEDVMYRIVERVREKIPRGVCEPIEFRMALFALLSHVDYHIPLTDNGLKRVYTEMLAVHGGNYARIIRLLSALNMDGVPIVLRTLRAPDFRHNYRHAYTRDGRDLVNF